MTVRHLFEEANKVFRNTNLNLGKNSRLQIDILELYKVGNKGTREMHLGREDRQELTPMPSNTKHHPKSLCRSRNQGAKHFEEDGWITGIPPMDQRYSIFFFSFNFISWRLVTLQYCSGFCHTLI